MEVSQQKVHVIFGNGPIGSAAARCLLEKEQTVRIASRSGSRPPVLFDELTPDQRSRLSFIAADARNTDAVLRATADASHIYHCVNVLYQDWRKMLPPIHENLVEAAVRSGAVLAVVENLYMYARGVDVIDESTPVVPPTRKGLLRQRLHETLEKAAETRGLRWTAVRGSDYYGPGASLQSFFGTRFFLDPLFRGGRPMSVGNIDQPHTFTYVGDFGSALAMAALDERALGKAWIVPNDRAVTQRELAGIFFRESGRTARLNTMGRGMIAVAGLFSPLVRELQEMLYQKEEPYVVDGSRFVSTFGFSPTRLEEGVRKTLAWYKAVRDREA